ncbi:MAG: hypothetical protein A3G05_02420 [Candidatus Zambryskibacteria bacterium RIFCSPLOWO2_12_FULL_45_14]|uniref:Uncharacterized protein n=2 Tax=Candidatus Zambryskiibacteriota TaxID=1817925 RepID=A0A1G2UJW8_9BACT|nr:MAG: hypothetical protein A3H60_02380 [Candidatus Zambryskibacteria bacterium RIFCSPLOWO2_02_FULL_44_12b]OHB14564.1 MAG: hypothetical protein A3G05_02420 [Candidatus Zambryskibacteria bacterium RIFCSPLOWO2_12_FULL_45_14]
MLPSKVDDPGFLLYEENNFDILINESRLMHGRLRIAVAELFLFCLPVRSFGGGGRNRPEFSRLRFGEACRNKEILLTSVQGRPLSLYGGYCQIKFRSKIMPCYQRGTSSSFGAMDGQR